VLPLCRQGRDGCLLFIAQQEALSQVLSRYALRGDLRYVLREVRRRAATSGHVVNPERLYLVCVETLLAVSFATLAVCHLLDRKAQR